MELSRRLQRAMRMWSATPALATSVIVLNAIGIAGFATVFGPVMALLFAPLELPHEERLVHVGGEIPVFSVYRNAIEPLQSADVLSGIAVYAPAASRLQQWRLQGATVAREVTTTAVTPEFFETLDIHMQLGRTLRDMPPASTAVVISDRLWRTALAATPDVLGSVVDLGGEKREIVGVTPSRFAFPSESDAWTRIDSAPYVSDGLDTVARLRQGVSLVQANAALSPLARRQTTRASGLAGAAGVPIEALRKYLRGDTRSTAWMLLASGALFLALATVGSGNLLLVHGVTRRQEIKTRTALGASRAQLVAHLLFETLLLAVVSALLAFWLCWTGARWAVNQLATVPSPELLASVLIPSITASVAVVTFASGLAPALHLTQSGRRGILRGARLGFDLREALSAIQLAVALALLISAAMMARSLQNRLAVPIGFSPSRIAATSLVLQRSPEAINAQIVAARTPGLRRGAFAAVAQSEFSRNHSFAVGLARELSGDPAVEAVGALKPIPFTREAQQAVGRVASVATLTRPGAVAGSDRVPAMIGSVSPHGFQILGIRLLAGRYFSDDDVQQQFAVELQRQEAGSTATLVTTPVIVNEALARRLWTHGDGVGKYLAFGPQTRLVVGIVDNYQWAATGSRDRPAWFEPFTGSLSVSLIAKLRSPDSIASVEKRLNAASAELSVSAPTAKFEKLETLVSATRRELTATTKLIGGFAVLGAIVAALGAYTTIVLLIDSRRRELGVRMALGATVSAVRFHVARQAIRPLMALPIGWALAWFLVSYLSHLLFGVSRADMSIYGLSTASIVCAVFSACVVPMIRLRLLSPAEVLRGG